MYYIYENRIDIMTSFDVLYWQFFGYFVGIDVILFKFYLISCELLREDNALNSCTFNSWKVSTFFFFLLVCWKMYWNSNPLFLTLLTWIIAVALSRHLNCWHLKWNDISTYILKELKSKVCSLVWQLLSLCPNSMFATQWSYGMNWKLSFLPGSIERCCRNSRMMFRKKSQSSLLSALREYQNLF